MEKEILGFKEGSKGFSALVDFKEQTGFDVSIRLDCYDKNEYYIHGFSSTKSSTPFNAIRKFDPTLIIKHLK